MRPVAVALIVAMMGGCAYPHATSAIGTGLKYAGGAVITMGLYQLAFGYMTVPADDCTDDSCNDSPELQRNGWIFSLTGLAILVTGIVAVEVARPKLDEEARAEEAREVARRQEAARLERERAEQERIAREPIERARAERERIHRISRDQSFGLFKTAAQAARSGDCTTVIDLGDQVRAKDLDVWHGWFLRDVAIKQCLDAASATTPAAAPVTPDARPAPPIPPLEAP